MDIAAASDRDVSPTPSTSAGGLGRLDDECDLVMEPCASSMIAGMLETGETPKAIIQQLSNGYAGIAQIITILAEWQMMLGIDQADMRNSVEQQLTDLIAESFDSTEADKIFNHQSDGQIDWLPELIAHPTWRSLIYRLSERNPDCLMLNFAIKLISDAGFIDEVTDVAAAAHQLEIFSQMLRNAMEALLSAARDSAEFDCAMERLRSIALQSEHTYLYTQSLLYNVCMAPGATTSGAATYRRIFQELRLAAERANHDTTLLTLGLYNAVLKPKIDPAVFQALEAMLHKKSLNPADINTIYNHYSGYHIDSTVPDSDLPSVEILKDPIFTELLIDSLFRPDNSRLHRSDHRRKYVFILSVSAAITETTRKAAGNTTTRKITGRDRIGATLSTLESVLDLLSESSDSELLAALGDLFEYVRNVVVAAGTVRWLKYTVTDPAYYEVPTPRAHHTRALCVAR